MHQRKCTCVSCLIRPFSSFAFDLFTSRVRSLRIKVHANGFTWSRYHRTWQNRVASIHLVYPSVSSCCDLKHNSHLVNINKVSLFINLLFDTFVYLLNIISKIDFLVLIKKPINIFMRISLINLCNSLFDFQGWI